MKKILLALLILVTIFLVGGMYFAPAWLGQSLQRQVAETLGRELQIGKIRLNPLNFSAQFEQVVLLDASGVPRLTVSRVEADTGFWGFWARTGQLHRLSLLEPTLFIEEGEQGRLRLIELVSELFTAATLAPERAEIASLSLEKAAIVLLDRSRVPAHRTSISSFRLTTDSFDSAREGTFRLSGEFTGHPEFSVEGRLKWEAAGASGHFSLTGTEPQTGYSLRSGFTAVFTERDMAFRLEQAEFIAAGFEINLKQMARIASESLSVGFDMGLTFDRDGLLLTDGVAEAGAFSLQGLGRGSSGLLEIPVKKARLNLSHLAFNNGQVNSAQANKEQARERAGAFELLMHTESAGGVQVIGGIEPESGGVEAVIHIVEVPLSSLGAPSRGLYPQSFSKEVLSADGKIQLMPSVSDLVIGTEITDQRKNQRLRLALSDYGPGEVAALFLAGQFQSGGTVELHGLASPEFPLQNSYVEVALGGMDARLASPLSLELTDRPIISGTLDTRLALTSDNGRFTGRQSVAVQDLQLAEIDGRQAAGDRSMDFALALLQDAENRVAFSLPIDFADDDLRLTSLVSQAIADYLREVAAKPFETLANLLGANSGDLGTVFFEPGQAGLTATAMAQLEWMKTALQWRPGLFLAVSGAYDPGADRFALAWQQVRLHVLLATAADADVRANASPISFSDPKIHIVLDEFSGSRLGAASVNEIAESFGLAGEAGGQASSAAVLKAYYGALFDALVIQEPISDRALLNLARYRARAVIDQLRRHGIERHRLSTGEQHAVSAPVFRGVPVSVTLDFSDQSSDPASVLPDAGPSERGLSSQGE